MNLVEWFEKGMDAKDYIEGMNTHKENLLFIYNRFRVPDRDRETFERLQEKNIRVIVLTEDWCGDAMLNIPILLRITELAKMEVRMLLRDQNLKLMDQYLTNGTSRSIPIFIFIDQTGNELAVWGPRAPEVQRFVDEERSTLPPKDDPQYEEKQKALFQKLTSTFTNDENIWKQVYESIKETVRKL